MALSAPLTADQLDGRTVTVLGAARSGLAVAELLARHGARVYLSDRGTIGEEARARLDAAGVAYEDGGHSERVLDADFLVVSPGVPSSAEPVRRAEERGVPVWSEVEVASWLYPGPVMAVTGTNGKTTTTALLGYIVERAGLPNLVAGNIGLAFSEVVPQAAPKTVAVLEVSSFQLDHVDTFQPRVAVILNVTPDHLDRYDNDFEKYAAAKYRLFARQCPGDYLVYNYDDEHVRAAVSGCPDGVHALGISLHDEPEAGGFLREGHLVLRVARPGSTTPTEETLMPMHELSLRGRHNLYNSLAGAVAARAMEISSDVIRESLASFEGVPHRLERVREVRGVTYVNDSKATNVNALWYALESFTEPVVLLAGGRDKGNDYGPVRDLVRERCRAVVGFGESGDKVLLELGGLVAQSARAQTLQEALQYAQLMAESGDVVLLSPACASFDQFRDYEDRGDQFKRIVQSM